MTQRGLGRSRWLLAACVVVLMGVFAGGAPAGASSPRGVLRTVDPWFPLGGGADQGVYALAVDQAGLVYAGGLFDYAGGDETTGIAAERVARWNPVTEKWHALDEGVYSLKFEYEAVWALAAAPGGTIYVGGIFDRAGSDAAGVATNGIAVWDGTAWQGLAGGLGDKRDTVAAIAVDPAGNNIYVGGSFASVGNGIPASNVARWNPTTGIWAALGAGLPDGVAALALAPDGTLYAGGTFYLNGASTPTHVVRWDGAAWQPVGAVTSDGTTFRGVSTLAAAPNGDLYVGGAFEAVNGVAAANIARWQAATATWEPLGAGTNAQVEKIVIDPAGVVFAGGWFTKAGGSANRIAKWESGSWQPLGDGLDGGVWGLALTANGSRLYVGGTFDQAGTTPANNVAVWDRYVKAPGPRSGR
ncbi:MAG TPA: hypothetical protein VGE07_30870 [Herpetosiphonaceae bacterium]